MKRTEELRRIAELTSTNIDYLFFEQSSSQPFSGIGKYWDGKTRIQLKYVPAGEIPDAFVMKCKPSIALLSNPDGVYGTDRLFVVDLNPRQIVDMKEYTRTYRDTYEELTKMKYDVVYKMPKELENKITLMNAVMPDNMLDLRRVPR